MHSLEPEIRALLHREDGTSADVRLPLSLETRAVFSIRRELQAVLFLGVAAVTTGAGLVVKENLDHIGPMAIIVSIAFAAVLCFLPAIRALRRGTERRMPADFLLLLAALLVSSDLGYAEYQFRILGEDWTQHLLALAAVHAFTAYLFGSRQVLSVALTSFMGWVGAEATFSPFFPLAHATVADAGLRCLVAAFAMLAFRVLHRRFAGPAPDFTAVFEGFAVHLAGVGALMRLLPGYIDRQVSDAALWGNVALLACVVGIIGRIGWMRRQEHFVLAALAYGVMGLWRLEFRLLDEPLSITVATLLTLLAATVLLWRIRGRFKDKP